MDSFLITIKKSTVSLFRDPRFKSFREVFWFGVITLAIHFSYRFWTYNLHFWPIASAMGELQDFLTGLVYRQSAWADQHLLRLPVELQARTIFFDSGSWITINKSCAGDKQILQFMLLILIYPGPWKKKLWFIPMGMVILHLTNVLRIVLLSLVSAYRPEYWNVAHNIVLRGMFYVVILILWIVWMERFNNE